MIGKFDCRVFCHINSLEDKISNTAATIQPNPFWFWENISYHFLNLKIVHFIYRLCIPCRDPKQCLSPKCLCFCQTSELRRPMTTFLCILDYSKVDNRSQIFVFHCRKVLLSYCLVESSKSCFYPYRAYSVEFQCKSPDSNQFDKKWENQSALIFLYYHHLHQETVSKSDVHFQYPSLFVFVVGWIGCQSLFPGSFLLPQSSLY